MLRSHRSPSGVVAKWGDSLARNVPLMEVMEYHGPWDAVWPGRVEVKASVWIVRLVPPPKSYVKVGISPSADQKIAKDRVDIRLELRRQTSAEMQTGNRLASYAKA